MNDANDHTSVFHFLPGNTIGGISLQTLDVASSLNEKRYKNTVATPAEPGDFIELAKQRGIETRRLPYNLPKHFEDIEAVRWNGRWFAEFIPSVIKLRQAFRKENPDIVHINGLLLLQPAIAAWLEGIDVVWYLVSDNIYPSWLVSLVIPVVNRISTEIVLISESNREFYRQEHRDVTIIPGAIDVQDIESDTVDQEEVEQLSERFDISEDTIVITTIGKTHPMKGQEYAIEALAPLDAEFKYLIVGPKRDRTYIKKLERMIDEYDLDDQVHITGFVDDKFAVLSLTDIFLLPSIGEGTPLSIMEALAIRTPVIASDVGGVPELLANGEAGQLVPPKSPDRIRKAIKRYLDHPELATAHALRGFELVRSEYSIEEVAKRYANMYSNCHDGKCS